jgi:hypothetical protein
VTKIQQENYKKNMIKGGGGTYATLTFLARAGCKAIITQKKNNNNNNNNNNRVG